MKLPAHNSKKIFILFYLLESSFYRVDLQRRRIIEAKIGLNEEMQMMKQQLSVQDILKTGHPNWLKNIFADIHFFLVAVSNLKSIFLELRKALKLDPNFMRIFKKYNKQLEKLNIFRDHLEHIVDKRLEGKDKKGNPLRDPMHLGELLGDDYHFGGESFNLNEAFTLVDGLYRELEEIKINYYV